MRLSRITLFFLLLSPALSLPARAQVTKELDVYWRIDIFRQDTLIFTNRGAGFCPVYEDSPAYCTNGIDLPQRELRVFERLCGSTQVDVIIEPHHEGIRSVTCEGNGPWSVVVTAKLQDVHGTPQGEDFPVTFTMLVTPEPARNAAALPTPLTSPADFFSRSLNRFSLVLRHYRLTRSIAQVPTGRT